MTWFKTYFMDTVRGDGTVPMAFTAGDTNPNGQKATFDFFTTGSLAFPATVIGVKGIWALLRVSFGDWADKKWMAIAISAVFVLGAYFYTWSDLSSSKRIGAAIFGVINTLLLAAAVLGIEVATD